MKIAILNAETLECSGWHNLLPGEIAVVSKDDGDLEGFRTFTLFNTMALYTHPVTQTDAVRVLRTMVDSQTGVRTDESDEMLAKQKEEK